MLVDVLVFHMNPHCFGSCSVNKFEHICLFILKSILVIYMRIYVATTNNAEYMHTSYTFRAKYEGND